MTPYQKSVLVSVLVGLALLQLTTIGLTLGKIGSLSPEARRRASLCHRTGGMISLTIVAIIAYYCLKLWPDGARTARVWAHAIIGTALMGLLFVKVMIRTAFMRYYSRLPVLGGALFIVIIMQWLASAGWYFFLSAPGY